MFYMRIAAFFMVNIKSNMYNQGRRNTIVSLAGWHGTPQAGGFRLFLIVGLF